MLNLTFGHFVALFLVVGITGNIADNMIYYPAIGISPLLRPSSWTALLESVLNWLPELAITSALTLGAYLITRMRGLRQPHATIIATGLAILLSYGTGAWIKVSTAKEIIAACQEKDDKLHVRTHGHWIIACEGESFEYIRKSKAPKTYNTVDGFLAIQDQKPESPSQKSGRGNP